MAEWFQRSRGQGLHPVTSKICFSVVPSANPLSRFVNEAAWLSGLGRWCCNSGGPGFKSSTLSLARFVSR